MASIQFAFQYHRLNAVPLTDQEVFENIAALENYIANDAAYVAQIVGVRNGTNNPDIYVINEDHTYSSLGQGSGADTEINRYFNKTNIENGSGWYVLGTVSNTFGGGRLLLSTKKNSIAGYIDALKFCDGNNNFYLKIIDGKDFYNFSTLGITKLALNYTTHELVAYVDADIFTGINFQARAFGDVFTPDMSTTWKAYSGETSALLELFDFESGTGEYLKMTNVVQTVGTSTSAIMSQNAVTSAINVAQQAAYEYTDTKLTWN